MTPPARWRRPRKGKLFLRLCALVFVVGVAWSAGLVWYATLLPSSVSDTARKTDAIVVLTGGSGRLQQGLDLLSQKKAEKLFVSGVYRGVDVRQLLELSQDSPNELECCVTLGYQADNTRGNAIETAKWMRDQGYGSLRLVTAAYHMPRSLLEFHRNMPGVEILPHPVFPTHFKQDNWWRWPGSASLLITEYSKYIVALFYGPLQGAKL